jgi:hypothetical protein
MQGLRQSTEWKISALYYVIGGLFIPRGINLIYGLIMTRIDEAFRFPIFVLVIMDFLVISLALWAGTSYSAKYIMQRYVIQDKIKITNKATIVFALIQLGGAGLLLAAQNVTAFGLVLLESIFATWLFYFLSNKYIGNTEFLGIEKSRI